MRAYVGAYEAGYQPNATTGMAYARPNAVGNIIGKAVANAIITMRTYVCDPAVSDRGEWTESSTEQIKTAKVTYTSGKGEVAARPGATKATIEAGKEQTVEFTLSASSYYYKTTIGLTEPNFYFRDIPGITVTKAEAKDSLQTSYRQYTHVTYTTSQNTSVNKASLIGLKCGSYFDVEGQPKPSNITVRVTLRADITASGNYNWMDYVFWDVDGVTSYSTTFNKGHVVADSYDVNQNDSVTDLV